MLDEASFERTAASRLRDVGRVPGIEGALEEAFVEYFRELTANHGVRALGGVGEEGIWRFRPEETRFGALPVDTLGATSLLGDHDGAFRREVAQRRPRKQFFSVGNPLFDAVIRSLRVHATGRTYAVECVVPDAPPWIGLEFVFTAVPSLGPLEGNSGLAGRAEAVFLPVRPIHYFYGTDGERTADAEGLLRIRRGLVKAQVGASWWDLGSAGQRMLAAAFGGENWDGVVIGIHKRAGVDARGEFSSLVASSIAGELDRIAELEQGARQEGAEDELVSLRLLRRVLADWQVELDGVGLLSVNGNLRSFLRS